MHDIPGILSGLFFFLIVASGIRALLLASHENSYTNVLALALSPMLAAITLQFLFLFAPGHSNIFYSIILWVIALASLIFLYYEGLSHSSFHYIYLIPIILAAPLFLIVSPHFSSFDPANYFLIGKTFAINHNIADFPFVLPNRHVSLFSWFSHPPTLPLIYSSLLILGAKTLIPYVGAYYYLLLLILVFKGIRQHGSTISASAAVILLATTPLLITTAASGFTASMRLFFFTAVVLTLAEQDRQPLILAGVLTGCAMASHIIGILVLPGSLLVLLMTEKKINLRTLALLTFTALVVGGFWYGWVLLHLHSLDTSRIFSMYFPELTAKAFRFQFAQQGMNTPIHKVAWGILGPFTRIQSYGVSFITGLVLFLIVLFKQYEEALVKSASGILIVYLTFHVMPVFHTISLLSPRYPLTIVPILLIAGFSPLKSRTVQLLLLTIAIVSGFLVVWFLNPYTREPCHYCAMKTAVDANVDNNDRVLVVHSPYFFIENADKSGMDSIDTKLASLYAITDLNQVLSDLKTKGFTHILMPWAPTPFESDSFIHQLFQVPGILTPVYGDRSFHLYKIDYPNGQISVPQTVTLYNSNNGHNLPVTAYATEKGHRQIRFWHLPSGTHVFSSRKGTTFSFSEKPLWSLDAGTISTRKCNAVRITLKLNHESEGLILHPILAEYDHTGKRIALVHPKAISFGQNEQTLKWPTSYPAFVTNRIPLQPSCDKISLALTFYKKSGGFTVESLEVIGYLK